MRNSKGFTMIELLAVLIIIMSIAAFSIANVMNNSRRFQATEAIEKLGYLRRELQQIAQMSEAGGGTYDFTNGGNITTGFVSTQMGVDEDFLDGEFYDPDDYRIMDIQQGSFTIQVKGSVDPNQPPVVRIHQDGSVAIDSPHYSW